MTTDAEELIERLGPFLRHTNVCCFERFRGRDSVCRCGLVGIVDDIKRATLQQPDERDDEIARLREALQECRLQLEYLDGRFPTGTTPAVLTRTPQAGDAIPDALWPFIQHNKDCVLLGHWMEAADYDCDCGLAKVLEAMPMPTTDEEAVERVAVTLHRQANINIGADPDEHTWEDATEQTREWSRASAITAIRAMPTPTTTDAEQVREAAAKLVEGWEGDLDYTDDLAAAIRAMPLPTTTDNETEARSAA